MTKFISNFLLHFIFFGLCKAQNLIPDSSFEQNKSVPMNFSEIAASKYWSMPSQGTSDLYCKCSRKAKLLHDKAYSEVDVPKNLMGYQEAHSGTCYAGFFAVSHGNYREYLQTPLTEPLEKNKTYCLSFFLSLADYSPVYVDQLGACFLTKKSAYTTTNQITDLKPLYINVEESPAGDIENWHRVSINYKAKGGETYLLLGCFNVNSKNKTGHKAPKETKTRINQSKDRDAYYYIDDVSLIETVPEETYETPADAMEFAVNEIRNDSVSVFKSVLFATNKTDLLPASYNELNTLAEYLINNPEITIEINGHTDNTGNEKRNKRLSEGRALAVADYLIAKGIDKSRVSYVGYGSSKPIADNASSDGRQKNRRVEFVVIR